MKKISRGKKFVIIFAAFLVLAALSAWFGMFALHGAGKNVSTVSRAGEEPEYDVYSLDVSSWTPFTYRNAPDFDFHYDLTVAAETFDTIRYSLLTTQEEQYSMEASLTSSLLNIPQNKYAFRFSFFTRMREETPHKVTLLFSEDGENFAEAGSVLCAATNGEFKQAEIVFDDVFKYLKLEIRTYYSYELGSDLDRGIFFSTSGFALAAEKDDVLPSTDFQVVFTGTSFTYNGQRQIPAVEVRTDVHQPDSYAYDTESFLSSDLDSPSPSVNVGNYVLYVTVRNRSNHACFTATKEYEITPAELTVNKIEYASNNSRVVVLNADVTDESGRSIDAEELGLTYFTSTVNGRTETSASRIMPTPTERFSVGITVTSGNFVPPTENTFVSVNNSLDSAAVFYIEKNLVYTYSGVAIDVTKNAFFLSDPATPSFPATAPVLTYFDLERETNVSEILKAGSYRCNMTYINTEYQFFVTVQPRPVSAFLYSGNDMIKNYDGTADLFDAEQGVVVTQPNLLCIDDPDFAGEDGFVQTAQRSDDVRLQFSGAAFARTVGATYMVLNDPFLSGSDASNYYLAPSLHVVSATSFAVTTVYEKDGGTLRKTADSYYLENSGKTYVTATFTKETTISPGAALPTDVDYYEVSGGVYTLTDDATFVNGKEYFTVNLTPVDNVVLSILPTYLVFKSDKDDEGQTITCKDKIYEQNDFSAEPTEYFFLLTAQPDDWLTGHGNYYVLKNGAYVRNTLSSWATGTYYRCAPPTSSIPVYGGDLIPYVDFTFRFTDCNVGKKALTVELSDQTLYDRYLPDVITPTTLYGNVVPRPLTLDPTTIVDDREKTYDGTVEAHPTLTGIVLTGDDDLSATLAAAAEYYVVSYRRAYYSQSDVGSNVPLTIEGITLTALTASWENILRNYTFEDVVTTGTISPKPLEIYSKSIHIYEKQTPILSSNAESDSDLQKRIYESTASANAGGDDNVSFTATVEGSYILRIDCLSANYVIPGNFVLIPMTVTTGEKSRQKIIFSGLDLSAGTNFTLLVGASFTLDPVSVELTTRLSTGLTVQCVLSGDAGVIDTSEREWVAQKPGLVTVTASQEGDRYFYAADPVVLTLNVVSSDDLKATASISSDLYGGSSLPTIPDERYTVKYKNSPLSGVLTPSDDTLSPGKERDYTYYFTPDTTIGSFIADFSVDGTYYVKSGTSYEVVSGKYNPYDEYYVPKYDAESVTPGDSVPPATYYEYVYIISTDQNFIESKEYFLAEYGVASDLTAGEVVPSNVFYEKTDGTYRQTESGAPNKFKIGTTYYTRSYSPAAVTAGNTIEGEYFEKGDGDTYALTADTVFSSTKTYYIAVYTAASVVYGADIPSSPLYYEKTEDVYTLTEDKTFVQEKITGNKYYRIFYRKAEVEAGTARTGTYYEPDATSFRLTYDYRFVDGKSYFTKAYVRAYFVSEGSEIDTELYRVEGENSELLAITEGDHFDRGNTYMVAVWKRVSVSGAVPGDKTYYEKRSSSYRLSEDESFILGKNYYIADGYASAPFSTDVILYEKINGEYCLTDDTSAAVGKTYYAPTAFVSAVVQTGALLNGKYYYEKTGREYFVTSDTTFNESKQYYERSFVQTVFLNGDDLPNDEEYYHPVSLYTVSSDAYFARDKIYFTADYRETDVTAGTHVEGEYYYKEYTLVTGGNFVQDVTYYRIAYTKYDAFPGKKIDIPAYEKDDSDNYFLTSDELFDIRKTYYLAVYVADTAVKIGDPVPENEYYTCAFVEATERYFMTNKTYYVAAYTAVDKRKDRLIDPFNTYYTLEAGNYVLVTDDEFTQGTTYYCVSYVFLGQIPITIKLDALKPTVILSVTNEIPAGSSSRYGETIDLYDLIRSVKVLNGSNVSYQAVLSDPGDSPCEIPLYEKGTTEYYPTTDTTYNSGKKYYRQTVGENIYLPRENWRPVLTDYIDLKLMVVTKDGSSELTAAKQSLLKPGSYTISTKEITVSPDDENSYYFLKMTPKNENKYQFLMESAAITHTVGKNVINVTLPMQSKFYGESIPTEERLLSSLVFSGNDTEANQVIAYYLSASIQAYSYSDKGEYPLLLSYKNVYAVGSDIPADVFYEKSGDIYGLTTDDKFVKDKKYYVVVYRQADVTVGETFDTSEYYIYNVNSYIHPFNTEFEEGVTYYVMGYEEADIYSGITVNDLNELYDINLIHGYLAVSPISISVGATSSGHDFGSNPTKITPTISIISDATLTEEEMNRLYEDVLVGVSTHCDATSSSDSGDYPISIVYNGTNVNLEVTVRYDCVYQVHFADLNSNPSSPSFVFSDASILYDGKLHSITVSYNTRIWDGVTITYDKDRFSEVGNYLYTATVSKKNYNDLVLTATMSICTLTVRSSNRTKNAATVVISDPTCYNGVNGDFSVLLKTLSDEDSVEAAKNLIAETETNVFSIAGVYMLETYLNSESTEFGFSSYTVSISPTNLKFSDDLKLYAYYAGQFRQVDFTYQNGTYTFSVSSNVDDANAIDPLSMFAFANVTKTTDAGVQYKWIFIAIIGVIFVIVIGIILSGLFGSGKSRVKSRKRHGRWA